MGFEQPSYLVTTVNPQLYIVSALEVRWLIDTFALMSANACPLQYNCIIYWIHGGIRIYVATRMPDADVYVVLYKYMSTRSAFQSR